MYTYIVRLLRVILKRVKVTHFPKSKFNAKHENDVKNIVRIKPNSTFHFSFHFAKFAYYALKLISVMQ